MTDSGRILVWFSCGAASAVAAKIAVTRYGREGGRGDANGKRGRMSTDYPPPVDPLAELVRAAIAWRYRTPGVAESVSALLKAVELYERSVNPTPAPAGTELR